jgi:hypothetical protein
MTARDAIDAFAHIFGFPIPDPAVQPVNLRDDHRLRRRHEVHALILAPGSANLKIHSKPHPRSENRSESTWHALPLPVSLRSTVRQHDAGAIADEPDLCAASRFRFPDPLLQ